MTSELYSAATELQDNTIHDAGLLMIDVGSAKAAGFEEKQEVNVSKVRVQFKAELKHRGLLPHWKFSVPRGGTWNRWESYEKSLQVFENEISLKHMLTVEAQRSSAAENKVMDLT